MGPEDAVDGVRGYVFAFGEIGVVAVGGGMVGEGEEEGCDEEA